ncbi:MAG: tetratricopeptide repeat protein [Elusimicrobia bacterium]|nr:tetratricopeptide repeat protein [Elusimicrobiota bacterium]MBK7545208.1 tetratricopeptide repeat protein [Elusimicrobiota bacterium]MBK7574730.1 tetratricopeptide repeat protein [Elusimicrobiota bacterium]MBK7688697.1 tetratricopeptide repeat protein [Elusimicrobiota bacterium]MBK8126874.1 tetratricopeptide repeat protein [Elusimicrobiota bacterium]
MLKNRNNKRTTITRTITRGALAVLVAFPGGLARAAATNTKKSNVEPLRTYQFRFEAADPIKSIHSYLDFIRKVSPGLEGLYSQYTVADLLMEQKQYGDAAKLLKFVSEIPQHDPYFKASVLMRMAVARMRLGQFSQAIQDYTAVLDTGEKILAPEAMIGLAVAHLAAGQLEKANTRFKELTAFYPAYGRHPRFMLPLGLILWESRRYDEALEYFLRNDKDPACLYFAGICYREKGKVPQAGGMFRRIGQEHPKTTWAERAHFEQGETFYQQGDYLLAAQTFADVERAHYSREWDNLALFRMACCDVRMRRYPEAEDKLWRLNGEKLEPALLANVTYLLTEALASQGKIQKLVSYLESTPEKKRPPENTYRLIWARAALGEHERVVRLANEFLTSIDDPELTPRTLLLQAYAFQELKKGPESFANFQLVVENFGKTPYAAKSAEMAAMNFFRLGEFKSITTQVNSLWNQISPEMQRRFPEAMFWMAHAYMKLNDGGNAQRYFQDFVKIAPPKHPWVAEALRNQALALSLGKSHQDALPILLRAYQNAQAIGDKTLMARLALDLANTSFNARKYEDAVTYYRLLLTIEPKHPEATFALFQEAVALHRGEYYNDAVAVWEKLAQQFATDKRAPEASFRAARTRFEMAQYAVAIGGYEKLIQNYPQSPFAQRAFLQIGQSHFNAGDYPKAIEAYLDYKTRYAKDPEITQVDQLLSYAYYKSGMSPDEISKLTAGQAKSPVLADIYWEEGAKAYNNKDYAKARESFQKLLYEFPSATVAPQASFFRAESVFLQENWADAIPAYGSFLSSYPDDPQKPLAQFHLAVSHFNLNEHDKSAEIFEAFSKNYPNHELAKSATLNAAISYARTGDPNKTTQAYLNYASLYPDADDVGMAYIQLGQFLEKAGQETRALEAYRRVPKSRPEYPQALYQLGRLHKTLNEPVGERRSYEALRDLAKKSDPYRVAGVLALADMHVAANDAQRALGAYEDVAANAADDVSRTLARQQIRAIKNALKGTQ